ncbi:MAG: hypothetical protein ACD_73C00500G0003, partial [uncultured bacterium]
MSFKSKTIINFLFLLGISSPGWATTFTVNATDDIYDNNCDNAHCCLRDAIGAANDNPGTDTIEI